MAEQVRVASAQDLASGQAQQVEVGDTAVALVRIDDEYYALADRCTHANYSLSEGEVDTEDCTLECWKHGAQFSLTDGEPLTLPATVPAEVFDVQVIDGEVFVTLPDPGDGSGGEGS